MHLYRLLAFLILACCSLHGHGLPASNVTREEALLRLLQVKLPGPLAQYPQLLKSKPEDLVLAERMGRLIIAEARGSGTEELHELAEVCAQYMLHIKPQHPPALLLRGHALLALHRFHEAEDVAHELLKHRQQMEDHALLGDALMEQGMLEDALPVYQTMIDTRPCLPSYSRVAHFRWLKGDVVGAIELAEQAVTCGSYRDPEPLAWATTRLAFYHFQNNDLADVLKLADRALELVKDYPQALTLRGRALMAQGQLSAAAVVLRRACERTPLPEIQWALQDLEPASGTVVGNGDPRSLALHLATKKQRVDEALDLAKAEMRTRRDVFSWDALAWAQYAAGKPEAARISMQRALSHGTQDARLHLHAGIILQSADHLAQARRMSAQLLPSEQSLLISTR
jgi:tetratricopeptide (TPR) repeat protein